MSKTVTVLTGSLCSPLLLRETQESGFCAPQCVNGFLNFFPSVRQECVLCFTAEKLPCRVHYIPNLSVTAGDRAGDCMLDAFGSDLLGALTTF